MTDGGPVPDPDAASADTAADEDDFANIMAGFERLSRAEADPDRDVSDDASPEMPPDDAYDDVDDAPTDMGRLADVLANISRLTAESAKAATEPAPEPVLVVEDKPQSDAAGSAVHLWQEVLTECPVKSIADVVAAIGLFAERLDKAGVLGAAKRSSAK